MDTLFHAVAIDRSHAEDILWLAGAAIALQAEARLHFVWCDRTGSVLLIGHHQDGDTRELGVVKELPQDLSRLVEPHGIGGVDHKEEAMGLAIVSATKDGRAGGGSKVWCGRVST